MLKGVSEALSWPSLTLMTMSMYSPAEVEVGVPDRRPVDELNDAQVGRLTMLKLRASPSASNAAGVSVYVCPVVTDVGGVPEIVGALFDGGGVVSQGWPLPTNLQVGPLASVTEASAMAATRNATAATLRAVIPDVTNLRCCMSTTPLS